MAHVVYPGDVEESPRRRPINPLAALAVLGVVVALLGTACLGSQSITAAVESNQLAELGGVEDLRERFNDDAGSPRLILLLSPT